MKGLLDHITDITRHRDHDLLDVSIVAAIRQIAKATQVRMLEVSTVQAGELVYEKAWIHKGKAVFAGDVNAVTEGVPIACYPALQDCRRYRDNEVLEFTSDGQYQFWLPIWLSDKLAGCIQIESAKPVAPEVRQIIHDIIQVYSNYQTLIDLHHTAASDNVVEFF